MLIPRIVLCMALLVLSACAPSTPELQLPQDCRAEFSAQQLLARHWLNQPQILRLRQSALLEIGAKKIPLEGFLRLDLQRREARLLAMNEMGLVLFDLQVSQEGETMQRAIPQLQKVKGMAQGIAQSLREIFLLPQPKPQDQLEDRGASLRLWRSTAEGRLGFIFDCRGDLRETRQQGAAGGWRVAYDQYRSFAGIYLPGQIVMNDYPHRMKLSLWLREVKQEP